MERSCRAQRSILVAGGANGETIGHGVVRPNLARLAAGVLLLLFMGITLWTVILYTNHGSVRLGCGTLSPGQTFLDGSRGLVQRTSWHMGNGLRTWGTTYGITFARAYVVIQITHVNLHWTPTEAGEDQ